MLTLDLKKSNANEAVQGKLILNITTHINVPVRNGNNALVPGIHNGPLNGSSHSLTPAADNNQHPPATESGPVAASSPASNPATAQTAAAVAAAASTGGAASGSAQNGRHASDRNEDLPNG